MGNWLTVMWRLPRYPQRSMLSQNAVWVFLATLALLREMILTFRPRITKILRSIRTRPDQQDLTRCGCRRKPRPARRAAIGESFPSNSVHSLVSQETKDLHPSTSPPGCIMKMGLCSHQRKLRKSAPQKSKTGARGFPLPAHARTAKRTQSHFRTLDPRAMFHSQPAGLDFRSIPRRNLPVRLRQLHRN